MDDLVARALGPGKEPMPCGAVVKLKFRLRHLTTCRTCAKIAPAVVAQARLDRAAI